ncbi:MAG: cob(I)alamin adenosyltransferase [Thermodesulfobacteriota bacterium]|nr:cob(I)alamin adenosyltransferase [Thermodesulfobacteriota bacterium]
MVKSLLIVNTGDGKGKTTAALGQVFRALGHGFKVCVLQFLKGTWKYGELEAAKRFPDLLEIHTLGRGFTWRSDNIQQDIQVAKEAWDFAKQVIASRKFKLVVLDELTYLISYGMVDEKDILECLKNRPEGLHVIVTGRDASSGLKDLADLVTEMKAIKHPFNEGIKGQRGIEF